jgi:hypothetical protein
LLCILLTCDPVGSSKPESSTDARRIDAARTSPIHLAQFICVPSSVMTDVDSWCRRRVALCSRGPALAVRRTDARAGNRWWLSVLAADSLALQSGYITGRSFLALCGIKTSALRSAIGGRATGWSSRSSARCG